MEVPVQRDRVETSDRAKPFELLPLALSDLLIVSIHEVSAHQACPMGWRYLSGTKLTRKGQATPATHDIRTVPLATG
jgi:hypothetical protein